MANLALARSRAILIEILCTNLLVNAVRYKDETGEIEVQLSDHQILIANPGGVALNPDALFKRFRTASFQTPGSGLGLAIVQEIAKLYGWEIRYAFAEGRHIFSLSF